jgi:hypothetical protein
VASAARREPCGSGFDTWGALFFLGSKPSLCRISTGVRLCFGYSLLRTPLMWEPLALGLPLFLRMKIVHYLGFTVYKIYKIYNLIYDDHDLCNYK